MSQTIDWSSFTRKIYMKASVQQVYDAWVTPSQIEQWFLEKADFQGSDGTVKPKGEQGAAGDTYEWKWHNWDHTHRGRLIEANGRDKVAFTFTDEGNVTLTIEDGGTLSSGRDTYTRLTLTQDGCPLDDKGRYDIYYGCSLGWSFWMVNLKAWLEHGITLNDIELGEENSSLFVNS